MLSDYQGLHMFEGIVFGFFVFALGYVGLMRLMARKADVLYGEFILSPTSSSQERRSPMAASFARLLSRAGSLLRR